MVQLLSNIHLSMIGRTLLDRLTVWTGRLWDSTLRSCTDRCAAVKTDSADLYLQLQRLWNDLFFCLSLIPPLVSDLLGCLYFPKELPVVTHGVNNQPPLCRATCTHAVSLPPLIIPLFVCFSSLLGRLSFHSLGS